MYYLFYTLLEVTDANIGFFTKDVFRSTNVVGIRFQ
jgi:hypothetical protein